MSFKIKISVLLIGVLFFVHIISVKAQCNDTLIDRAIVNSGMDALFIRDFKIKQGYKTRKRKQKTIISVAKYNVRLHKGILYRFNIENDVRSQTKAILQLQTKGLLHASTYNLKKQTNTNNFDYLCSEDAQYQVLLSFLDGGKACAVAIMSVVINDSTITSALTDSVKIDNILYVGIDNYVDIASSTNPNGSLKVSINRGVIEKEGGLYRIFVKEEGDVTVKVTALDSLGKLTETFKTVFNVQNKSMPQVTFMGSSGGLVTKNKILSAYSYLTVSSFNWSDTYSIKMFTVSTTIASRGISVLSTNTVSVRQKAIIEKLKNGETFYIKDIIVEDKNGQVYNLPPLGFIISDY